MDIHKATEVAKALALSQKAAKIALTLPLTPIEAMLLNAIQQLQEATKEICEELYHGDYDTFGTVLLEEVGKLK